MHGQLNVRIVDDGQRNCPKHVELYSKNKFEKLVHLVGFIVRISSDNLSLRLYTCFNLLENVPLRV